MDIFEAIRARRSVRRFSGDPLPKAHLETIVDAGRLAASGNNRQPWDFVVVTERATIAQLSAHSAWMAKAGALIVVVMDPGSRWWVEDGAAAIENILLASTALGYGSCWVEGDALPYEEDYKSLLGIPAERRLMAIVPIGAAAAAQPAPEKKPLERILHWEKF